MGRNAEMGDARRADDEFEDEMEIDGHSKEKSRDSGRHRSKDRRKGKHEDTDHGHRDRERSSEEHINRDSSRYDARDREKDRLESRDRRKEERSDHGREKDYIREQDRSKDRSRDKQRDYYDRDSYKEKERDKDKVKTHDPERELSTDKEHDGGRDCGKDRGKEREKIKEIDKERDYMHYEDRGQERDRERSRRERDREKDGEKDYERGKVKERDREKEKERDRDRPKDRERDKERSKDWDKQKDKEKDKERDKEIDKSKERDRDRPRTRDRDKEKGGAKETVTDERTMRDTEDNKVVLRKGGLSEETNYKNPQFEKSNETQASSELQERLMRMKEERMKRKSDDASEILSWVSRSRKLEEKKAAENEVLRLSQASEDQDKLEEDEEDETVPSNQSVAGVKILHGLDKVMEGGAVVLTLKDQNILADGDINHEVDMLENVEIGEQKRRDEAYKAAKKKTGVYDDKFSNDTESRRSILPQYDDPVEDEGIELNEGGRFTGEAEKKLQELRKRMEGISAERSFEDLNTSGKVSSDYYTPEEMVLFKKPKKKKSLRKKEKLDLDALEAEAISAGLGADDLGSRRDQKRQAAKEEQEKIEAQIRSNAYQEAYTKAEEASKALRQDQTLTVKSVDDEDLVFGDDYEDLQKSLEQARRIAIKKQEELANIGPQAVALLVSAKKEQEDSHNLPAGEMQADKVVITEMEEFVLGLQLNEEKQKPESEDVFMDEDIPQSFEQEPSVAVGGSSDTEEGNDSELPNNKEEDPTPDEIIHEAPVGKGLAGALHLLKERGTLNETVDWGGRNMDKKKSKLVGLNDNDGPKEIRIERTDEFGRIMTPKEAFRILSHKFHGKGPGKMKQEKRMKQYQEDLKRKQMKASDTPLLAMERMREAQAQLKTPYLVLSGHVKPGQTSDPRSGFATVEKDHLGSLTPMLGDKKVEHFLGIKRKPETGSMPPPPPKKPKS